MHNNLAIALESAGDVDAAIAEYSEAVRLAPTEVIGRLNLGTVLGGRGRPDEALAQFDEVVRLAPHVPEAQLARAEILARQGRLRDAVDAYRAALRIRPDWPPAAAGLAWMLASVSVMVPDVRQAVTFVVMVWFYATPIVYPLRIVPDRLQWLSWLNPMTFVVESYRGAMLQQQTPALMPFAVFCAVSVVVFIAGYRMFDWLKYEFADVL